MAQLNNTTINGDLTIVGEILGEPSAGNASGLKISGGGLTMSLSQNNELNFTGSGSLLYVNWQNAEGVSSGPGAFTSGVMIGNGDGAAGNVTANTFNAQSDKRLKENLSPYKYEKSILDLPIYKFDFINGVKNQIGCMAQDLQEICPEIVNQGEDGYLSIQESKIVYLLLQEVKHLRKELDELKKS